MAQVGTPRPLTKAQWRWVEQQMKSEAKREAQRLVAQMLPDVADRPGDEGFRRLTQTEAAAR